MDVKDYLERLEMPRAGEPSAAALKLLHERHLLHVPFENLDVRMGVPIVLETEAILEKIVRRRRGGFCYELNGAFAWLLDQLGYDVQLLGARVVRPDGELGIPFDHLALKVELDRPYLVDVGFGESFHHPLALDFEDDVVQHGVRYRIRRDVEGRVLERYDRNELAYGALYVFALEPRQLADFEPGCRHHQTSPESPFTQKVVCSVAVPDGRLTLAEDRLILTRRGQRQEEPLADDTAWLRALKRHMGIALTERP